MNFALKPSVSCALAASRFDTVVLVCELRALLISEEAALASEHYTLFHELGHALIHIYDIPAVGREEDAVDQFSALILLEGGEGGYQALQMAIALYHQSGLDRKEQPFWDVHSLDHQRHYDMLCLMYGKDPKKHADLVPGLLPKERADGCEDEYRRLDAAWDKLLAPHLKTLKTR